MDAPRNNLLVLTLVNEENVEIFKELEKEWQKYFFIEQVFDKPENLEKYVGQPVGILFLCRPLQNFKIDYAASFQKLMPNFLFVAVVDTKRESDFEIYKNLADQIFYIDSPPLVKKWNSIAIIRRFWNIYSKPTTVIYKSIIADFVERKVYVNQKLVELTQKEFEILRLFIQNRGHFISKEEIYRKIWNYNVDLSRSLDQMIFKLKTKIGKDYFSIKRGLGIKFE